jgi:hypothetical protein
LTPKPAGAAELAEGWEVDAVVCGVNIFSLIQTLVSTRACADEDRFLGLFGSSDPLELASSGVFEEFRSSGSELDVSWAVLGFGPESSGLGKSLSSIIFA